MIYLLFLVTRVKKLYLKKLYRNVFCSFYTIILNNRTFDNGRLQQTKID